MGGELDLVLTNVPYLCNVNVQSNAGRSDHASLGVSLNLSPTVAGFDVARRVLLNSRVNWKGVVRLYLDLVGEAFSGVRPWFRILIWQSVELWSDLFSEEKRKGDGLV